ncbi:MAG: hypothetical protein ACI3W7_04015 [Oscillospiraceae bacterium]
MRIKKMIAHFGASDRTLELCDGLNVLYTPDAGEKTGWYASMQATMSGAGDGSVQLVTEDEPSLEALDRKIQSARSALRKNALASMGEARRQAQEAEAACQSARDALERAKAALNATPYGEMGPEEASRRSELDRRNAGELLRLADKLPPVKWAYIPLAIAVAAFLAAFFLPWKTECAGVGCVFILLFVVMFTRLQGLQKTKADTLADRQRILDAYGVESPDEIEGLLAEYRRLWKEKERAEFRMEEAVSTLDEKRAAQRQAEAEAVNNLDFTGGDNEAVRLTRERESLRDRIAQETALVLEDSFDGKDIESALERLRAAAEKRQVLLFTSSERVSAFFADDPAVTIIQL